MTIIAEQYDIIFNNAYKGSNNDGIVDDKVALRLRRDARLDILTKIMYMEKIKSENLPASFDKDLDEFGYTVSGMLEWTAAKLRTTIDEFVDIDADNDAPSHCEEQLSNKADMCKNLKEDISIYMKLKILVEKEQLYRNQYERSST